MFAIKTFKNHVYGNRFTINTDHKALLWIKTADNNTRVQEWRLKLSDYEYIIQTWKTKCKCRYSISKSSRDIRDYQSPKQTNIEYK